jgi:hypothetical protein
MRVDHSSPSTNGCVDIDVLDAGLPGAVHDLGVEQRHFLISTKIDLGLLGP